MSEFARLGDIIPGLMEKLEQKRLNRRILSMNSCYFSGRLVADAETRVTPNGKSIVTFKLAVDSGFGEYKRTDYLPCVLFGGEKLAQYLTKGKPILVSTEVRTRSYEKKTGEKAYITEFIVKQPGGIEFQQGAPKQGSAPGPGNRPTQQTFYPDADSEIPF